MKTRIRRLVLLALPLLGCDHYDCLGIGAEVRPSEATLRVGDTFTPRAFVVSCDGGTLGELDSHWSVTDTTVIRVDSISGEVTAVGVGVAAAVAVDSLNSAVGESTVTVEP